MGANAPRGQKWMEFKQEVFRRYGTVCILCDHGGATRVEHVIPVSLKPSIAWNITNMRPGHGTGNRCPTCGQCCGQVRGTKPIDEARAIIAAKAAGTYVKPKPSRWKPKPAAAKAARPLGEQTMAQDAYARRVARLGAGHWAVIHDCTDTHLGGITTCWHPGTPHGKGRCPVA